MKITPMLSLTICSFMKSCLIMLTWHIVSGFVTSTFRQKKISRLNISAKHKEGSINQTSAPYNALFELGNAYRINFRFDMAKETFAKYLETLLPDDHVNINFIKHQIEVCDMAKDLISKPVAY